MKLKSLFTIQNHLANEDNMEASSVDGTRDKLGTKRQILRNLAVISLSFLFSFTAFSGTVNLQTSLNTEDDLGNKALTALNLGAIISNLLLSTLMVNKLGLKWSLIISLAMHITFPIANFYPTWYTLYPGAIITGLGGGPLWSAKSAYLTILGEKYAALASETAEAAISRFFGIFFMIYRGSTLTGNVISSLILQRPASSKAQLLPQGIISQLCGCNYCYQDLNAIHQKYQTSNFTNASIYQSTSEFVSLNSTNTSFSNEVYQFLNLTNGTDNSTAEVSEIEFYKPTNFQIYLLFGAYLFCGIIACPLIGLVSKVETKSQKVNKSQSNVWSVMLATLNHMKDPKELLLLPMAFFSGVSYAFITADYCVGFVTCTVGIDNVGYVMTAFGAAAGIGSVVVGPLLKYTGRKAIFLFGGVCNIGTIIWMLYWPPSPHTVYMLYVLAALWGICNAIWTSQLNAFIGFVFKNENTEAAFACNFMWQMIGNCLWHAFSMYMCLDVQGYVMIVMIILGLLGYLGVEVILYKNKSANVTSKLEKPTTCVTAIERN